MPDMTDDELREFLQRIEVKMDGLTKTVSQIVQRAELLFAKVPRWMR